MDVGHRNCHALIVNRKDGPRASSMPHLPRAATVLTLTAMPMN